MGASCTVVVTFSGAATGGGTVAISYADGAGNTVAGHPRRRSATPRRTRCWSSPTATSCGVDSRPADFGTVGTSATRWFTVRNNGAKTAAMVRDAGLLGGAFDFAGGSYPGANGDLQRRRSRRG